MGTGLNVLVTGASGFVGHHVVEALDRAGAKVHPLVRKSSSVKGLEKWSGDLRVADLRQPAELGPAVKGMDVVIHLAGLTRARNGEAFDRVNGEGVAHLARACLEEAPDLRRFVLISSAAAAGPSGRGPAVVEDRPPAPVTPYGRSKLLGERRLVETLGDRLPWTIVRPPIVYGPWERDLFTVFRLCRRGLVPLLKGGRPRYSVVYAPDLARGIVELMTHPGAVGETFFLAEAEAYTYRDLVLHVGRAVGRVPRMPGLPVPLAYAAAAAGSLAGLLRGRPPLVTLNRLPEMLAEGWVVDASKARRLVGETCVTPFPEGARLTARWYVEEGWL